MKVVLYNAITADGFIATSGGDSEWVSEVDVKIFDAKIKEFGCIAMGGKTFRQFKGDYFPKKDALNIIISKEKKKSEYKNAFYVESPRAAVELVEQKGFKQILLIGGGTINGSFLKENLIDELYLDVHPLIFGKGIKVFEKYENFLKIEFIDSKEIGGGQVLLHYKVVK